MQIRYRQAGMGSGDASGICGSSKETSVHLLQLEHEGMLSTKEKTELSLQI